MDPSLDSISHILMEETMDDHALCSAPLVDSNASYQAIFRSFYDIIGDHNPPVPRSVPPHRTCIFCSFYDMIGENPPLLSCVHPTSSQNLHCAHQLIPSEKKRAMIMHYIKRFNGTMTHQILNSGVSRATLPASGNVQSRFSYEDGAATKGQDRHAAIKVNDRASSWRKKEQAPGYAHFHLPSPYKEFSLKFSGVELTFQDLKLHDNVTALYVGECRRGADPARAPMTASKSGRKRTAEIEQYVDLKEMVVSCAHAVAVGDARAANEILQDVRHAHGASPDGNGSQRAVYYFCQALEARMRGTGGLHFRDLLHKKPAAPTILKAYKQWFEVSPLLQVTHYFGNQSILKAAEGASRLHIVDYGLEYGMQWPCLISALADQKGGPPLLVITAIDFPQPGSNPACRLQESGRRLAAYARACDVPFQYHAIASPKWADLPSSSFHFHEDEFLVVNCFRALRHLPPDQGTDLAFPHQKFLARIRSLNPRLLITAVVTAGYNASFFVSRFRDALFFYSNLFDMVDTLWDDSPERRLKEGVCFYRDILNIVACEGSERVERPETYKQWQAHISRAGFDQLPIPPEILSRSRSHVRQRYHKDFIVNDDDDDKWMLVGWKGRILLGMSAWEPSQVQVSREGG